MSDAPGFVHQQWVFAIPQPTYNYATDLNSAPLGLGGKYGASLAINLQFDWYTTGTFSIRLHLFSFFFFLIGQACTGGGAGAVTVKSQTFIAGLFISVTMYRPPSGGLDLQQVTVAMTEGIIILLLDETYSLISTWIYCCWINLIISTLSLAWASKSNSALVFRWPSESTLTTPASFQLVVYTSALAISITARSGVISIW